MPRGALVPEGRPASAFFPVSQVATKKQSTLKSKLTASCLGSRLADNSLSVKDIGFSIAMI